MEKLDRSGWAAGVSFRAYGLDIGVRVNSAEVPADVLACLPPGWAQRRSPFVDYLLSLRLGGPGPRPGSRNFYLLHAGLEQVARTLNRDEALLALEGELQRYVATRARERVFIHAGVVEWRGRAILLPGRSFAGKSTLVQALLAAGATYYSDEYAVLDRRGRVHPYPRRLSLRREGVVRDRPTAAEVGARTGVGPIPVGLVVFTEYRPGAEWQPRQLSPARALFELASNAYPEVAQSRRGRKTLQRVAVSVPVLSGRRGEAAAAAEQIMKSAERPRTSIFRWPWSARAA